MKLRENFIKLVEELILNACFMIRRIRTLLGLSSKLKNNIFSGAGSIIDIGGTYFQPPKPRRFLSFRSDEEAIRGDFFMIGQDINNAFMKQLDENKDLKINESTRRKPEELTAG